MGTELEQVAKAAREPVPTERYVRRRAGEPAVKAAEAELALADEN